jgi:NitT/TauT family transport system ATP-binding protein
MPGDMRPAISAIRVRIEHPAPRASAQPVVAVDGLDLVVERNRFVSLIGPSGCGKSTFLRGIADLDPRAVVTGELRVNGRTPAEARRRNEFALVFQDPVLLPWRRVIDNVRLPLEVARRTGDQQPLGASPDELLALVGLATFANALPRELSGGMRQRVAIARALTTAPSILLMDEPFGALDEITRDRMNVELLRIWASTDASVVFVTHSIPEAVFLSDQVVVMTSRPGQIRSVLPVDLPRPRTADLKRTNAFLQIENDVRDALGS